MEEKSKDIFEEMFADFYWFIPVSAKPKYR